MSALHAYVEAGAGQPAPLPPHIIELPVGTQVVAQLRFATTMSSSFTPFSADRAQAHLAFCMAARDGRIDMVVLGGTGDPLATPEPTLRTIDMVRKTYPNMRIGLRTLGIDGGRYARELVAAGVDYVEIAVHAVSPEILAKVYAWIRPERKTLKLEKATIVFAERQRQCVAAFGFAGAPVVIGTTVFPEINTAHLQMLGEVMQTCGASAVAISAYHPDPAAPASLREPTVNEMERAEKDLSMYLSVCEPMRDTVSDLLAVQATIEHDSNRPNVAVASSTGTHVDLHLGKCSHLLIIGPDENGAIGLRETRETPPPGGGDKRWRTLAETLADCFALVAAAVGDTPRRTLEEQGISVLSANDNVSTTVAALYSGKPLK
jgi:nitrogen fixation protein NifB